MKKKVLLVVVAVALIVAAGAFNVSTKSGATEVPPGPSAPMITV